MQNSKFFTGTFLMTMQKLLTQHKLQKETTLCSFRNKTGIPVLLFPNTGINTILGFCAGIFAWRESSYLCCPVLVDFTTRPQQVFTFSRILAYFYPLFSQKNF